MSTKARARQLRRQSTDAERKLWSALRNRQLAGYKFRRQITSLISCVLKRNSSLKLTADSIKNRRNTITSVLNGFNPQVFA